MPCYEVRTVSVEFKIKNIDLLKKAIEKVEYKIISTYQDGSIHVQNKDYRDLFISTTNSLIQSKSFSEKELTTISNQIKRAYSELVIEEVAKKQKWIKKNMGSGQFQLQRL